MQDSRRGQLWLIGPLDHAERPTPEQIFEKLQQLARHTLPPPLELDVAHLFELPEVPRPPPGDPRPLRHWRVEVDFECADIRLVGADAGVFAWPEQPAGTALASMERLLVIEALAKSSAGPEYIDFTDLRGSSVRETSEPLTHPL
ncbi:MAG: hypothetical protein IT375_21560 [Polyangiaceae bacterium]|nr:hypothetical protein [Polyangiaceae bacterium]